VRRVEVTSAHAGTTGEYIQNLLVDGDRVWAVGRGSQRGALLLYSSDGGRTFAPWGLPLYAGLRDALLVGDRLWVVGDQGWVATTSAAGGDGWTPVRSGATGSLYDIARDAAQRLWILGNDGVALMSPTGKRFRRIETRCTGRIFALFAEPTSTWMWDSDGTLQRAHGKKPFVEVEVKAMRTKRPLTAMARTAARTLILVGDGGLVLRSTTDGVSWKKIPIDSRVDLEQVRVTPYGIFAIGDHGSLLVSHDDGVSFQGLESDLSGHLWALVAHGADLLVAGADARVWRLSQRELALLLRDAHAARDPVVAGLASRVHEGEPGAELVLEDALRERQLW
jgi:photosystem II stability/assembly factor-like uncharacterized protein